MNVGMVGMGVTGTPWGFGLLVAVGAVVLIVVLMKAVSGRSRNSAGRSSGDGLAAGAGQGRQILDERYARGELTTEEYLERVRILEQEHR